jgi:hypothetical protein
MPILHGGSPVNDRIFVALTVKRDFTHVGGSRNLSQQQFCDRDLFTVLLTDDV